MPSLVGQNPILTHWKDLHSCHERTFFIHFTGIVTVLNRNPFFPFSLIKLQPSRLKIVTRHILFIFLNSHICSSPYNPSSILSCSCWRSAWFFWLRRHPSNISFTKSLLYSLTQTLDVLVYKMLIIAFYNTYRSIDVQNVQALKNWDMMHDPVGKHATFQQLLLDNVVRCSRF
jgi:hypothetical protein